MAKGLSGHPQGSNQRKGVTWERDEGLSGSERERREREREREGTWGCEGVRFDRQDTRLDKEHAANGLTRARLE